MSKTFEIIFSGQVQGVGFRPYVYLAAHTNGLAGFVSNNENGVIIQVTGELSAIDRFYEGVLSSPPPLARITSSSIEEVPLRNFQTFKIIPSKKGGKLNLTLTPDFAICSECKEEIKDPANRRYHYPFTTCVNCGPRWAITRTFPFERENTALESFIMCNDCGKEYEDPADRRFHSQTNTCYTCGIPIFLTDHENNVLPVAQENLFFYVAGLIKNGNIVAIKNTGGYLLCCDAANEAAIKKLRQRKNRPRKPFAVLYPSIERLEQDLHVPEEEKKELKSVQSPIVIISNKNFSGKMCVDQIASGLSYLGIMLPYSAILQLLTEALQIPIIATSGNIHGSPIISDNRKALEELASVADYFVQHHLEIRNPQDDSVIKFSPKYRHRIVFRRSRGFAPGYFGEIASNGEKILALGAHLKSSVSFLPNDHLYISQYLGNLDNADVYTRFSSTAKYFVSLFEQEPDVILVDSHPGYNSTLFGREYARLLGKPIFEVQHHKAHFASVLGEHQLFSSNNKVLGVVWDGTGYGDDGQIWGGEFFIFQDRNMERINHFTYFDWIAGDKMAKEPRISCLALCDPQYAHLLSEKFTAQELSLYQALLQKDGLKTSSVGRIFDALASLLNICDRNSYEGEAAILLESRILSYTLNNCTSYLDVLADGIISSQALFKNICRDLLSGKPTEKIIINFFYTLAKLVFTLADRNGIKDIALSGGVFQNACLVDMLYELGNDNYNLYFNRELSPNDENISFGQIMSYLNLRGPVL